MKFESHIRHLPSGEILRFYQNYSGFNVQRIVNPGVLDGRLKKGKREWRDMLFKSADRSKAVDFFNAEFKRYSME